MIRRDHFYYDVHQLLISFKVIVPLLIIGSFLVLTVSFGFVYLMIILVTSLFAIRGLIGRRCPQCDSTLKEDRAEVEQDNAFVMVITWRCPKDGYEEQEKTKGDAGLFGVN